jgi:hypothetical protein
MLSQTITICALALCLFAPSPEQKPAPAAPTQAAAPRSVSLIAVDGLVLHMVVDGTAFAVDAIDMPETELLFFVGPSVIEVSWTTAAGRVITIKTPCAGLNDDDCAKASFKAVTAAEKLHGAPVKKE